MQNNDNQRYWYSDKQAYHYFAFMNFFQMPSLYHGEGFRKSLEISAKKLDNEQLANKVYELAAQESARVLDHVIKTLKPAVPIPLLYAERQISVGGWQDGCGERRKTFAVPGRHLALRVGLCDLGGRNPDAIFI